VATPGTPASDRGKLQVYLSGICGRCADWRSPQLVREESEEKVKSRTLTNEVLRHGSCFFGSLCFLCAQDLFVRCAVLCNERSTDLCITRNANFSDAGNFRLRKFFVSQGSL